MIDDETSVSSSSEMEVCVSYPNDVLTVAETLPEKKLKLTPASAVTEMDVSSQNVSLSEVVMPDLIVTVFV